MKQIGFLGFGEAAYHLSAGLLKEGLSGIIAYDAMQNSDNYQALIRSRAQSAEVELLETAKQVVDQADIIIASVPSTNAVDLIKQVGSDLRVDQLYVDITSSSPAQKEQIAQLVGNETLFVDIAMLGSLPERQHKVPMVACGPGAQTFANLMQAYGMKITPLGPRVGAAAAVKLMRSVYMKGIAGLMLEMLQGASRYGVADYVIASIADSMDGVPFEKTLNRLVTGSALHYKRRADELDGSAEMLRHGGVAPVMTEATQKVLHALQDYDLAQKYRDRAPSGWQEVIRDMTTKVRED